MTLRVLSLCIGTRIAPSTRYRLLQFLPALEDAGIDVTVAPLFDENYHRAERYDGLRRRGLLVLYAIAGLQRRLRQLRRARDFDLVVVERELLPRILDVWPAVPDFLTSTFNRYVLEFDDALYALPGRAASVAAATRSAQHVIVGNETLATFARAYNGHVTVIPTCVDLDRYRARRTATARAPFAWPENFT